MNYDTNFSVVKAWSTYRLGNEEPGEEIEERVEEGSHNGRNLSVGGERHHHHPIVGEGDEHEEHEI